MNIEKALRELRLMKGQPNHRFYAALWLAFVGLVSHPAAYAMVAVLLWWN